MTAESINKAWTIVNDIFPTDYIKDEMRSERAGYPIYVSTADGETSWISDLGNRLEVNLSNGQSLNVWIEEKSQFSEGEIADALDIIDDAIYQIDDKINSKLAAATGIADARNVLYDAYKVIAEILKAQHPNSKLFDRYNLADV